MKTNIIGLTLFGLAFASAVFAQQTSGGITPTMLQQIKQSWKGTPSDKAILNAITNNDIDKLAVNRESLNNAPDTSFTYKVHSEGITNQKSSGRCWLFTGLNVMRSQAINRFNLGEFTFSQNYCFFYDQLEKSNLFLQGIIDTRDKPMDDRKVDWLFHNPIGDGGQFTGVADILMKYGVVPSSVMVETNSSDNTNRMASLVGQKLKEFGLQLRDAAAKGAKAEALEKQKTEMLGTVYRMLVLNLGEPPTHFSWTNKAGVTKDYTPQEFYNEYIGQDLKNDYIMLMNDPSREYYKLYTIDYDRHTYDGENWTYVNLPADDIKAMGIASLKDNTALYFSCDVGKFFDRSRGILDPNYYDYGSLMGTTFGMDKKQRIETFASGSSHAMTLMAVKLDNNGKPTTWMVENSWGPGANDGHLIMTDQWFNEYMFRLVVNKKYITDKVKEILKQKPIMLPAWDPMFAEEE